MPKCCQKKCSGIFSLCKMWVFACLASARTSINSNWVGTAVGQQFSTCLNLQPPPATTVLIWVRKKDQFGGCKEQVVCLVPWERILFTNCKCRSGCRQMDCSGLLISYSGFLLGRKSHPTVRSKKYFQKTRRGVVTLFTKFPQLLVWTEHMRLVMGAEIDFLNLGNRGNRGNHGNHVFFSKKKTHSSCNLGNPGNFWHKAIILQC